MDETTARFLVSASGARLLDEVAALPGDGPARVLRLRKRGLSAEQAAGAVEVADARARARFRFADAGRLFWTREALAQATSPLVAAYHARRLAPFGTVADLGCGVGMDAVALAAAGARVVALERDPVLLVFAQANAAARGVHDRITFVRGDVTTLAWHAASAFWDPSRRKDGQRVSRHADRYEPPLEFLDTVSARVRGGCVKLSPALPDAVLGALNGNVEFLSDNHECKEAALWFGEAAELSTNEPKAVLLPEGFVFGPQPAPTTGPLGAFVHDPDPAIVRARALGTLAEKINARLLSPDDAYLTSPAPVERRWASSFRVLQALPYQLRTVRAALRAQGVGRLVVKKRHFPKEPDEVARELCLDGGGREVVLLLARDGNGHLAVLCEPIAAV